MSHAGPLGRMVSSPCLNASSFGYMGGGQVPVYGDAEVFERFHLTDREKAHRIIGVLKRYDRTLHEWLFRDHHVMTLVIVDGEAPLITVYCHPFKESL